MVIQIERLNKSFSLKKKPEGFFSKVRSFIKPETTVFQAVHNLDLRVEKGESIAFIGPNGAGKSTTIKILTGILHPTSGEAKVLGMTPWRDRKKLAFRIGSVFGQKSQLWLHLPAIDTFNLLARIYELDQKKYLSRRDELIELFEIKDFIDVPTRKLSLGQRMRCEIAACLLHRPEVLFLDEPTIGLDPVAKSSIRELIKRANKEEGVTVFLTSHDVGDIERLCKRVVIVNHGQIIFDAPTNDLRRGFLSRKEIDLKISAPWVETDLLPGVEIKKSKGFGVKLSVDTKLSPIDKVVSEIMRHNQVEDITIQNVPMEEIITSIYRKNPAQSMISK